MEMVRNREKDVMFLTKQNQIKKVLHKFGMHDSKPVQTLLVSHFRLSTTQYPKIDTQQQ